MIGALVETTLILFFLNFNQIVLSQTYQNLNSAEILNKQMQSEALISSYSFLGIETDTRFEGPTDRELNAVGMSRAEIGANNLTYSRKNYIFSAMKDNKYRYGGTAVTVEKPIVYHQLKDLMKNMKTSVDISQDVYYDNKYQHSISFGSAGSQITDEQNLSETGVSVSSKDLAFKVPITSRWPSELLRQGFHIVKTSKDKDFGTLIECSGSLKEWSRYAVTPRLNFWIAPDFGGRVIRTTFLYKSNRSEYVVKKMARKSGIWFPISEEILRYRMDDNKETLISKNEISIHEFSPNRVQEQDINFAYKPGDRVQDVASSSFFRVGANGEKIYKDVQDKDTRPSYLSEGLVTGSLISLLVLTVGAYIWWKRKQLSRQG